MTNVKAQISNECQISKAKTNNHKNKNFRRYEKQNTEFRKIRQESEIRSFHLAVYCYCSLTIYGIGILDFI
jgi:hypothetical protein